MGVTPWLLLSKCSTGRGGLHQSSFTGTNVRPQGHRCTCIGYFSEQAQCLHLLSQLHFEVVKVICGVVRVSVSNTTVELLPSECYKMTTEMSINCHPHHALKEQSLFFPFLQKLASVLSSSLLHNSIMLITFRFLSLKKSFLYKANVVFH